MEEDPEAIVIEHPGEDVGPARERGEEGSACSRRMSRCAEYMMSIPILAPILFAGAMVGLHLTRRSLNRLLRSLDDDLGVKDSVTARTQGIADAWLSYTAILDVVLLITTVLTSGVIREWLRTKLHTCILQAQSVLLGLVFIVAYLGQYIAIIFCTFCCLIAFVAFGIREACKESNSAADYAVAFLAQQIDQKTAIDIVFCTTDIDDIVRQFEYQADDDAAFSDDDNCLPSIEAFCQPYVHGIYRNALRLAIGSALVALVQINFSLLSLERYRTMTPLIAIVKAIPPSSAAARPPQHDEPAPIVASPIDDASSLSNPLLATASVSHSSTLNDNNFNEN